jgi:CBS domain containing-hemolysin-like protein
MEGQLALTYQSGGETIGIVICIVFSALFSATETAFTSLHHARLEQLIAQNRQGTRLLKLWRDRPAFVLSFLLLANNTVNILASSLATSLALGLVRGYGMGQAATIAIAAAVGIMTFLILTFGEIIPKTFARHNPLIIVPFLPLLLLLYYLTWPVSKMFGGMGKGFITLTGGDPSSPPHPTITEEELGYLIQRGTTEGSLDRDKERILSRVLDLEDKIAKEIMVPRTDMAMFESKESLPNIMASIAEHKYSRYPVYQDFKDQIIGFFYVKDLLPYYQQEEKGRKPFKLREFTRTPYYVPETKTLKALLREFQKERVHMAIVVDEYGGTSGLVTMEDVIEHLVGEIYDEYDQEETSLWNRVDSHTWVVHSKLPVEELRDPLGLTVDFPEDRDYDTVGGLLMDLAESVPAKGAQFTYQPEKQEKGKEVRFQFTVLESDGVKLGKIRLVLLPPAAESQS